ncbi:hypothetical protein L6452_38930 [Arctium lappa]|uniref:Uncharacterized protein n=1 Tax=Arctium lappa TaxID=4217 RepID=A0ACB8XRT4_ARCLA|nr:hypothetical protein L6452_38930 [Arctium lappa]
MSNQTPSLCFRSWTRPPADYLPSPVVDWSLTATLPAYRIQFTEVYDVVKLVDVNDFLESPLLNRLIPSVDYRHTPLEETPFLRRRKPSRWGKSPLISPELLLKESTRSTHKTAWKFPVGKFYKCISMKAVLTSNSHTLRDSRARSRNYCNDNDCSIAIHSTRLGRTSRRESELRIRTSQTDTWNRGVRRQNPDGSELKLGQVPLLRCSAAVHDRLEAENTSPHNEHQSLTDSGTLVPES